MNITLCHLAPLEPLTWSATVPPPCKFHDISNTASALIIHERLNSRPNTMEYLTH